MKLARRAAWILFAAGLTAGSLSDERVITLPRHENGFWILAADFHVHSFLGDGALPPWDIRREAERRGLDVIAITNHNQSVTSRLAARLAARSPGPLLMPGTEITAPHYHLTTPGAIRTVDWRQPLAAVIDAVHAQGGVAIAAHPGKPGPAAFDEPEILRRLDGIEGIRGDFQAAGAHGVELQAFFSRAVRTNPRIAFVGASDFHFLGPLGAFRTYLLAREFTEVGILNAIRDGRTVACDARGRANGHEALLRLVSADCAAAARQTPGRASQVAKWCVWGALAAMVVLTGSVEEA